MDLTAKPSKASTRRSESTVFSMPLMVCVSGLAVLTGLAADQAGLLMLASLLLLVVAAAKTWSRRGLVQLDCQLRLSRQKLFPGEAVTIAVEVDNAKLLPVWLQVKVPVSSAIATPALVGSASLFGFERARFQWSVTPARRGVHRVGQLQLEAADPLGFFSSTRSSLAAELVVYPRLVQLAQRALLQRDFFLQPSLRGLVEDPTLVSGAREYQRGRAARFIHWKASARQNRIIEKMCEPTEQKSVLLVVSVEGFACDPTGDAFERCLEVVASLAEQLERTRCGFGFLSNGRWQDGQLRVLRVARSEGQLAQLLEALARIEAEPVCELTELVRRAGVLAHGTTVVCFSYAQDRCMMALWEQMQQRKLPLLAVVCGPELNPHNSPVPVQSLAAWREESPSP